MTRAEFAALYDAHVDLVRSVLARLCPGDNARLDDLTQEVFLRAWRGQSGFRGQASSKTWLCRIAKNLVIDTWRSRNKTSGADDESMLEGLTAPTVDPMARLQTLAVVRTLPLDDQLLLVLACVEECSMDEIAEVLNIPAGTVKSRLHALRQRLRGNLFEEHEAAAGAAGRGTR